MNGNVRLVFARSRCLLPVAIVLLCACSDDGPPLFLQDAVHLGPGSTCQAANSEVPGLPVLGQGTLDLLLGDDYVAHVRYRNLASPGSRGNEISLRKVTLRMDWGEELAPRNASEGVLFQKYVVDGVEYPVSGGVAPGEWGVVQVPVIATEIGVIFDAKGQRKLRDDPDPRFVVSATLSVDAELQDGSVVHSNEMVLAVQLCWGCLVDATADSALPPPCDLGQDDPVDEETCRQVAKRPDECKGVEPPASADAEVSESD